MTTRPGCFATHSLLHGVADQARAPIRPGRVTLLLWVLLLDVKTGRVAAAWTGAAGLR